MKAPAAESIQSKDSLLYTADTLRSLGFVSGESLPLPARIMTYCCHHCVSSLYISLSPGFESSRGLNHSLTLSPHCCITRTPAVYSFHSEERLDTIRWVSVFCCCWCLHLGVTFPNKLHTNHPWLFSPSVIKTRAQIETAPLSRVCLHVTTKFLMTGCNTWQ